MTKPVKQPATAVNRGTMFSSAVAGGSVTGYTVRGGTKGVASAMTGADVLHALTSPLGSRRADQAMSLLPIDVRHVAEKFHAVLGGQAGIPVVRAAQAAVLAGWTPEKYKTKRATRCASLARLGGNVSAPTLERLDTLVAEYLAAQGN